MANELQDSMNYIRPFCRYMNPAIGGSLMPIIGIGNVVRNIILAPPMQWNFNRNQVVLPLLQGVQDYTQTVADLGFVEKATVQPSAAVTNVAGTGTIATITAANQFSKGDLVTITGLAHTGFNVVNQTILTAGPTNFTFANGTTQSSIADTGVAAAGQIYELKSVKNNEPMAVSNQQARPELVAVESDNGSGSYVFRFSAVPDAQYQATLIYQKAPVQFAALSDLWSPIPDSFSDIYNNMTMGYYMDSCQDGRAQQYIRAGVTGLLARATGLSQMEKAIFAAGYMNLASAEILNQLRTQQGQQAQGAR